MLLKVPAPPPGRFLRVLIVDEASRLLLEELLRAWQFTILPPSSSSALLLAEERSTGSAGLALHPVSPSAGETEYLPLPVPVEILWRVLEKRFHRQPRNHMRISLRLSFTLHYRGGSGEALLLSLSDMGARFQFDREMVKGEETIMEIQLAAGEGPLKGRVMYVVPRGELDGSGRMEIGVVFDRIEPGRRERLREFIIDTFLRRVRSRMAGQVFYEGLSLFQIPPGVRRQLDST